MAKKYDIVRLAGRKSNRIYQVLEPSAKDFTISGRKMVVLKALYNRVYFATQIHFGDVFIEPTVSFENEFEFVKSVDHEYTKEEADKDADIAYK